MTTLARPHLMAQVLRLMPDRLLRALDAWSYRVARRRAERRRLAISARQARAAAGVAQYKLQPWRD
jgi:hypothetical protein